MGAADSAWNRSYGSTREVERPCDAVIRSASNPRLLARTSVRPEPVTSRCSASCFRAHAPCSAHAANPFTTVPLKMYERLALPTYLSATCHKWCRAGRAIASVLSSSTRMAHTINIASP